jgi:hypothetical protein
MNTHNDNTHNSRLPSLSNIFVPENKPSLNPPTMPQLHEEIERQPIPQMQCLQKMIQNPYGNMSTPVYFAFRQLNLNQMGGRRWEDQIVPNARIIQIPIGPYSFPGMPQMATNNQFIPLNQFTHSQMNHSQFK